MDIIIFIIIGIIIGGVTAFSICWSGKQNGGNEKQLKKLFDTLKAIKDDLEKTV